MLVADAASIHLQPRAEIQPHAVLNFPQAIAAVKIALQNRGVQRRAIQIALKLKQKAVANRARGERAPVRQPSLAPGPDLVLQRRQQSEIDDGVGQGRDLQAEA